MHVCPAGHLSRDPDRCDRCGLPMGETGQVPTGPQEPGSDQLPTQVLATDTGPDASNAVTTVIPAGEVEASVQESTGQSATTLMPKDAIESFPATTVLPDQPPPGGTIAMPQGGSEPTTAMPAVPDPVVPAAAATEVIAVPPAATRTPDPTPDPTGPVDAATVPLGAGQAATSGWQVVLTVDEAWYAVQDTPYRMPTPGRSVVIPLRGDQAVIGRVSRSRGLTPDVDCSTDPGVSRRHAHLERVGGRWFIEDLGSANGTFVAPAGSPLPQEPIPPGRRVEVGPGDTVYLGAWTRLSLVGDDEWIPT